MIWWKLVVSVVGPLAIGWLGGLVTATSLQTWYPTIKKPWWNPPNWVFAPVWTLLFLAMGVALYRIWAMGLDTPGVTLVLGLFAVQLALNLLWSFFFFGLKSPGLALAEIGFLWVAVAWTMVAMGQLDTLSFWLLAPYLAWVSFAAVLNGAVWWLNR